MAETVSACIIAFNEEGKLGRCLESLSWCDEVIVVDSFSTDRTLEIAGGFTDKVFQQEWQGFAAQKEFAFGKASGDWILWVDADEEIPPALQEEIKARLQPGCPEDAFELPRKVWFLGRWIRHGDWYPDLNIRLFRKAKGRMVHREVHERVDVDGKVGKLRNAINHWPFDSMSDLIRKADQYSSLAAEGTFKPVGLPDLLFRPGFAFGRGYFLRRGFLDGLPGLVVALVNSASVGFKYAKRYERQIRGQ